MTQEKKISVFVDESGRFLHPDDVSRFYIVGLVLHDQRVNVAELVRHLDDDWVRMGLSDFCFHAGPLIRKEKGYLYFPREKRTAIFSRMLTFARQMDFRFHCLVVDKQFVTSSRQVVERLQAQLNDFLLQRQDIFSASDVVKVYYDCGQAPVTNLLRDTFVARLGSRVAFAQGVRPERFKLFQLADLICSVRLVREKIDRGMRLTDNEFRFFGGTRKFLRNVYKQFAKKEI